MNTTNIQPFIFMMTIYAGILSGLIYDFYRMLRKLLDRKWTVVVFDVLFVICFAAVITVTLYFSNSGSIRIYSFIGVALGFLLYMLGISPLFQYIAKRIQNKRSKKKPK